MARGDRLRRAIAKLPASELRGLADALEIATHGSETPKKLAGAIAKKAEADPALKRKLLGYIAKYAAPERAGSGTQAGDGSAERIEHKTEGFSEAADLALPAEQSRRDLKKRCKELESIVDRLNRRVDSLNKENGRLSGLLGELRRKCRGLEDELKTAGTFAEECLSVSAESSSTGGAAAAPGPSAWRKAPTAAGTAKRAATSKNNQERRELSSLRLKIRSAKQELSELKEKIRKLEARRTAISETIPPGSVRAGRFVRLDKGGMVLSPSDKPYFVSEKRVRELKLLDSQQVILLRRRGRDRGFDIVDADRRPRIEVLEPVRDDGNGVLTIDGLPLSQQGDISAGDVVSALRYEESARAEVVKRFTMEEAAGLRARDAMVHRRKRRSKPGRTGPDIPGGKEGGGPVGEDAPPADRPAVAGKILVIGGDRVGRAYIDELKKQGLEAEWLSGFTRLVEQRKSLRGAAIVVLLVDQVSHQVVRAVEKSARVLGARVLHVAGRGRKRVVAEILTRVERKSGGDCENTRLPS